MLCRNSRGASGDEPRTSRRLSQTLSAKWPHFRHRLKMTKDQIPSLMTINYGSNIWDTLGERCLACGSCTNVCPTCFCFDVQDEWS